MEHLNELTVSELARMMNLNIFSGDEDALSRPVTGAYIGDLLSWVMGRAPADGAWITIMQNLNVAAVAVLSDVSCVVLAEDVQPDEALLKKAVAQNVALLGSDLSAFTLAVKLGKLLP